MNNFCTLFDSSYLTRGLALHHSMMEAVEEFTLYLYCFDDLTHELLSQLELPKVILVSQAEFETPELLAVKPTRTKGEYCWTCTSHIIFDAIERFSLPRITYVDADMYFFADPKVLLDELAEAGGAVLITEHRYTPRYDRSIDCGRYCVQFITFVADQRGLTVLDWWRERCIEWCYNRFEDGKFGDQKYLDDWTERFSGIHILEHPGGGVAPWNVQQLQVTGGPKVSGQPVIFFHYHNLSWYEDDSFITGPYVMEQPVIDYLYRPYISALRQALASVRGISPGFKMGLESLPAKKKPFWKKIEHKLKRKYHAIR
jgi:hypothetical protein